MLRLLFHAALLAIQPLASAGTPPNIVYINADDLGVMDVGYNSRRYRTPNIDRLAAEGMKFTAAYAAAANCAPSRACVFSGQASPRHGIYTVGSSERGVAAYRKVVPVTNRRHLPDEQLTLAEALQRAGYRTIHLGKWHLGSDPTTQGFDENIGGDATGSPAGGYFTPFKQGSLKQYDGVYPAGTHRSDIFAEEAIRFLRDNTERPFFLHLAFYSVHTPLQPVPALVGKYQGGEVNATYASMIEKMDQSIGRVLDEIDRCGLTENTLVLFSSDNGGICSISSQAPHRAGKGSYFEGGIRVPLVVRWPASVSAGSECAVPVSGLDIFPTFVAAADTRVDKPLDGSSLLPLLTGTGSLPERTLYWHFPVYLQAYGGPRDDAHDPLFRTRPGTVLRRGSWKLHEYFEDGRLELYDLDADPGERINLVATRTGTTQALHAEMRAWRARYEAPVPTEPNPEYDSAAEAEAIEQAGGRARR